jgi:hypothetical protein
MVRLTVVDRKESSSGGRLSLAWPADQAISAGLGRDEWMP